MFAVGPKPRTENVSNRKVRKLLAGPTFDQGWRVGGTRKGVTTAKNPPMAAATTIAAGQSVLQWQNPPPPVHLLSSKSWWPDRRVRICIVPSYLLSLLHSGYRDLCGFEAVRVPAASVSVCCPVSSVCFWCMLPVCGACVGCQYGTGVWRCQCSRCSYECRCLSQCLFMLVPV